MMRLCQSPVALAVGAVALAVSCDGDPAADSATGGSGSGSGSGGDAAASGAGGASPATGGGGAKSDSGPMGLSLAPKPGDLTTAHDSASVIISASCQLGTPASTPAPVLSLRTHPADVVVPTTTESMAPDGSAQPPCGWVLHPQSPLAPGWYALVLEEGGHMYPAHERPDGGWESRFRVGSQPLLTGVGACASDDTKLLPKVRLDFSEAVTLPAGPPPIDVLVDGKPASCTLYDPPTDQHLGLGLTCSPPIPAAAAVKVTVGAGIVSATSTLPLQTSTGPLPQSFELPPIAEYQACRYWRETDVPAQ